jgi:pleckstrin homology-like domain family B
VKTVDNTTLKEEMDKTSESLENDIKHLEDLEFQYLEEETDWLAYNEELYNDFKTLKTAIDHKYKDISKLEQQRSANQSSACTDTKVLEQTIFTLLQDLEKSREKLKAVDQQLLERGEPQSVVAEASSGDVATTNSDSEEEALDRKKANQFMSQSLFGSHEVFASKAKVDFMSMSVNENMFYNTIEMPARVGQPFNSSTPKKAVEETKKQVGKLPDNKEQSKCLFKRSTENVSDPLLKLKYNLSTTYETSVVDDESSDERLAAAVVKLNLSLNGDEFEVNPLDKRVPSQDDIDRISKVTMDAPISTQGASYKVKESIKEIERNRQLLLAQQGSSVIEHERQRVNELKKRSHDEARATYMKIRTDSGADFDR